MKSANVSKVWKRRTYVDRITVGRVVVVVLNSEVVTGKASVFIEIEDQFMDV